MFQRGSTSDKIFVVVFLWLMRGERIQIAFKVGPSSAHQRKIAFRWRPDGGITLNAGLVAL